MRGRPRPSRPRPARRACRRLALRSLGAGPGPRRPLPPTLPGLFGPRLAAVRPVPGRPSLVATAGLREVRPSARRGGAALRRLPAGTDRLGPGPPAVRRAGPPGTAPAQVLRPTLRGRRPGAVDGRGPGPLAAPRCTRSGPGRPGDHVGTVGSAAPASPGLRPGRGPGRPGRRAPRGAGSAAAPPSGGDGSAGPAGRLRAALDPVRIVRAHRAGARQAGAGRRRAHHRRHGGRLRRGPPAGRGHRGRRAHRGPGAGRWASGPLLYSARAPTWVCGCPGERPPVVDASRRRNDPRKATFGRPSMVRFRCKSCPGARAGTREKVLSRLAAAIPSAGGCGAKDQVSRVGAHSSAGSPISAGGREEGAWT